MKNKVLKIIPGSSEWENTCLQCGICCLTKYCDSNGNIHLTNIRCDNLDPETHKCSCYNTNAADRGSNADSCFEHNGMSLTPETMKQDYLVPGHCPYVKLVFGVKTLTKPTIDWEKTVSEQDACGDNISDHIIPKTTKYFKYNPVLNKKLHNNMSKFK